MHSWTDFKPHKTQNSVTSGTSGEKGSNTSMQGSQLLEDFVSNTVLNVQNVRPRPTSHSQPMHVTEYSFFQKYVSYIKIHEQKTFIYQLSLWTIFVCLIISHMKAV